MNQTVWYSHKYNPSKRRKKYSYKYDKHHRILDPHRFWEKCKKIKEKTIKSHFMIICAFVGLQFMIGAVQYSHNSDKPQYMNFHILLRSSWILRIWGNKKPNHTFYFWHFCWPPIHDMKHSLYLGPTIFSIKKFGVPEPTKLYKNWNRSFFLFLLPCINFIIFVYLHI